jgi:hypothetical protein
MNSLENFDSSNTSDYLIYPEMKEPLHQYSNILLVDSSVSNYQTFIDSVNSSTFPIVYSNKCSKTELLSFLQNNFTTISRIGIVFTSSLGNNTLFLDNKPFYYNTENEPFSENLLFILNVIKDFQVKNIDFLACNSLNYPNWVNYYTILEQNSGVVVGASNDKTGNIKYGGNWVMENTCENIEFVYFTKNIEYYKYLLDNTNLIELELIIPAGTSTQIDLPIISLTDGYTPTWQNIDWGDGTTSSSTSLSHTYYNIIIASNYRIKVPLPSNYTNQSLQFGNGSNPSVNY